MRSITNQIKNLNTQIQEAINQFQDGQIKNSITEKTKLIDKNVNELISILTWIQNKYISQSENIQLSEMKTYDKLQLENKIYSKIQKIEPELSETVISKITNMILDLGNEEISQLINNNESLKERIDEGKTVLEAYGYKI